MTLRFIDGFDHYAQEDIPKKWTDAAYWTSGFIDIKNTSPRRVETKYLWLFNSNSMWVRKTLSASYDTVVLGCAVWIDGLGQTDRPMFFFDNASGLQCYVTVNSDGSVSVKRGDGTTLGSSSPGAVDIQKWQYLEIKIYVHDSSGTYEVKVDETTVVSGSGADTKHQATSGVTKFGIYSSGSGAVYIDDLYFDDFDFKGDCRVDTLKPDGAGNYAQWDPSAGANYQCQDDDGNINDDTDYVSTSVTSEIDTYAFENLSALGATIHGLAVTVCARKDDAGGHSINPLARVAGSDYPAAAQVLNDSYQVYQGLWDTNPDDSNPWEEADVNGAEFGVKLLT